MDNDLDPFGETDHESSHEPVGYKSPPKDKRWQPGYCPNPAGRPRKAKGRKAILERVAYDLCEVSVGARPMTITRLQAVLMAVRNATANGNPAAQKLFDKLRGVEAEDGPAVPQAVLIIGEILSSDEWILKYGHRDDSSAERPAKPIGMAQIRHLLGERQRDIDDSQAR